MYSELECGICYRTYNAGRRCPRELHCKHSFCESCLLALSRPRTPEEAHPGADRSIVCPLCRHSTSVSGEGKVRTELRVDEGVLERLLVAGVLEQEDDPEEGGEEEEEEEEEEGEGEEGHGQGGCDERSEAATLPETAAEESESSAGSRGGRLRRSWRKVWRKITGKRRGENCMTGEDMRNLAMMACYMF